MTANTGAAALAAAIALFVGGMSATGSARAEPAAKPHAHTVIIEAMKFTPATIEVHAGDTIIWKNKDPFPHTATAQDRSFSSGEIAPDRSWKFKAVKKGSFTYQCTLHTGMQGVLVVK